MPMETNISALWAAKQSAKGTENTTMTKRLLQVGGDFTFSRDEGTVDYSDLSKYGANIRYINSLTGSGSPACSATPDTMGYLLWLAHGAETVTNITGPPAKKQHTFTPSLTAPWWATFNRRVGISPVMRHSMIDCLIGGYTIEGSTAQKDLRMTVPLFSADPFKVLASDSGVAFASGNANRPFLYNEATGAFVMDTVTVAGQSSFTFTVGEDRSPVYGDDLVPYDFVTGNPTASIAITLVFDATGLARWNNLVYGTGTPSTGAKPSRAIQTGGSYSATFTQKDSTGAVTGNKFVLTIPSGAVAWGVSDPPAPNPGGGLAEVTLSGTLQPPSGGAAPYTIDVFNDDAAYTT